MSQQMVFVDCIAFGVVLSLFEDFGHIWHPMTTVLLITITEVLTAAHMENLVLCTLGQPQSRPVLWNMQPQTSDR